MASKVQAGVIGCGTISSAYFRGCTPYQHMEIAACADLDLDRARAKAEEFGVPKVCTVEELLADPDIQVVINLTIPGAHAEVNLAAIEAGKHPHCEKPLAVTREDGRRTMEAARAKGVRVGCAPDTFLGGGIQTCRKLIDDGAIGEPVAATAFMAGHGHESWHPAPDFYYQPGGGPMLDMGPYYLTALVNLIGPIRRVTGSTKATFPERTITTEKRHGEKIPVEVSTHYAGIVDFTNGAIGTLMMSFDVWSHSLPRIEIYGTEGTMSVPDPNGFRGPVKIRKPGDKEWQEIPLTHNAEVSRGIGVADLAHGLLHNRLHRSSGDLGYHVLDVMEAFVDASESGSHVDIGSTCDRPEPLAPGLELGELE